MRRWLLVFAELAGREPEWKQALEGWNMRQSTVILGWMEEGRVEGRRGALLSVLQARFKIPVPNDLAAAVQASADSDELSRWLRIAATVPSLDAFRAAILTNGAVAHQ